MQGFQPYFAFAGTARHGSFAAAARELGSTPSTLAKAVARLETTLGVRLFHRTTRQVSLTPDGERLFQRCQRVLAEIEELQADAAGTSAEPAGTLRVDLPITYGKRFVLPRLAALAERHAGLVLDVRLHDAQVDIVRDAVDLAVRIGPLADSTLVARRIDRQSLVLCASPAYLSRFGTPRRVEELSAHAAVIFRMPGSGRSRAWQFRVRGAPVELHPAARIWVNDGEGLVEATQLGLGLCQLPDYLVDRQIADGSLVELLPSCRPQPLPISVVYPSGRLVPARVRAAIDALEPLRERARPSS